MRYHCESATTSLRRRGRRKSLRHVLLKLSVACFESCSAPTQRRTRCACHYDRSPSSIIEATKFGNRGSSFHAPRSLLIRGNGKIVHFAPPHTKSITPLCRTQRLLSQHRPAGQQSPQNSPGCATTTHLLYHTAVIYTSLRAHRCPLSPPSRRPTCAAAPPPTSGWQWGAGARARPACRGSPRPPPPPPAGED